VGVAAGVPATVEDEAVAFGACGVRLVAGFVGAGGAVRGVAVVFAAAVRFTAALVAFAAPAGLALATRAGLAGGFDVDVALPAAVLAVDFVVTVFAAAAARAVVRLAAAAPVFAAAAFRATRRRRVVAGLAGAAAATTGDSVLTGETASTAWTAALPTARAAPPVALAADPAADAASPASLPASAATSWAASPACFDRLATCFLPLVACADASWRSRLASVARAASRRFSSFRISLPALRDSGPSARLGAPTRSLTASTNAALLTVFFADRARSLAIVRLQSRCSAPSP